MKRMDGRAAPWAATLALGGLLALAGGGVAARPRNPAVFIDRSGQVHALPRPAPGYMAPAGKPAGKAPRIRLVKVSERRNQVTDEVEWFRANGLRLPTFGSGLPGDEPVEVPKTAPPTFSGLPLMRPIQDEDQLLLIYGDETSGGRYLLLFDTVDILTRFAFDFASYLKPPSAAPAQRELLNAGIQWADEAGGLVYVSNFHSTYAKSSGGHNGYLSAIDLRTQKVRWRSRPLVCNSRNFVVHGDAILTGYGFTAEPDFLYVLNRHTGAVVQTVKLKSGPEYILVKGAHVFVRCYDTDYVFRIAQR